MLEVKGCIVTIDAMGTQTKIAQQIVGRGGGGLVSSDQSWKKLWCKALRK
ncbi:MAG: hypothetical protein KA717_27355 [Woronichinia naegeliana WA131]|uniref:Transposase n=1 Tax=Woronichinia naegeliana WA131 TaxID=2824559 RepID=A0A977PUV3_9CYAN|nr:MAG: hypothetical protein KA717_27355 [Woronichinia naegeliana WA131]